MATRVTNALSSIQRNFGGQYSTDLGGWRLMNDDVPAASATGVFLNAPMYSTYIPVDDYVERFALGSLVVDGGTDSNVSVYSPLIPVSFGQAYTVSISAMAVSCDLNIYLDMYFYASSGGSPLSTVSRSFGTLVSDRTFILLFNEFVVPAEANFAEIEVYAERSDDLSFEAGNRFVLFDPVICQSDSASTGIVTDGVYNGLPSFMLSDDENINDIINQPQTQYPLRRFVETLCSQTDKVADSVVNFRYDRAVDGDEHKSQLVDPDTALDAYLPWLALITGTTPFVTDSGFTPWAALEAYEGEPVAGDPGEWEDIESFADWLELQSFDTGFYDPVESLRNQIKTGFFGINAGRADTIEAFVRTLLATEDKDAAVVVVTNQDRDKPSRVKFLVDPAVDPDRSGLLIQNMINLGLPAGSVSKKVTSVLDSGRGSYDFSELVYPASSTNEDAAGAVIYGQSFISDRDGFGHNIVLNNSSSPSTIPELGGGIGAAHCSPGNAYFYGDISTSEYGSITSANSTLCDLSDISAGYDIIVVMTDPVHTNADVYEGSGSGTPPPYLFREKRLIIAGKDDSGSDNDWALYMVSGLTTSQDLEARLLFIDGYMDESATNYVYSDVLDQSFFTGRTNLVVRFTKDASDNYEFFIQNSLFDDWEQNSVGTGTFTPSSSPAGSDAYVQILGELDNGLWSDAPPLSCAVKHVLINHGIITFNDDAATSEDAHAIIGGNTTNTFGVFSYDPTIDINISPVNVYSTSFDATTLVSGVVDSLEMTLNLAENNDIDVLVARPSTTYDEGLWFFGITSGGTGNGDELTVSGLPSAVYDWVVNRVNPLTGVVDSSATGTTGGAVSSIVFSADDFGGDTLISIEVLTTGGTAGTPETPGDDAVAFFVPTTIPPHATSGPDVYDIYWDVDRSWYSGAYAPSQVIDLAMLHMYESTPYLSSSPELEVHSSFAVMLQLRRFWTGTEGVDTYDIVNITNSDDQGLRVYYDGPKIKADYTDGETTESVEWVEEDPDYGHWHTVVLRRGGESLEFVITVDGDSVSTPIALTKTFNSATSNTYFSQGDVATWTSRFGLAQFVLFPRYVKDNEITLLESEISIQYDYTPGPL